MFLAFLDSSGCIEWHHPSTAKPNDPKTMSLIESSIAQLVSVLEQTALVAVASANFQQPKFRVTHASSTLEVVPNWVRAWKDNLKDYKQDRIDTREADSLKAIENRLSYYIISGIDPEKFSDVVAKWAAKAGAFPEEKKIAWVRAISSCFNTDRMFNTPLALLKEIKNHCECSIEAGSIHFHTLMKVIKEGISRHIDYLGGSSLALGYTILPDLDSSIISHGYKTIRELDLAAADTGLLPPNSRDYPLPVEFLRAKLAYRVAVSRLRTELESLETTPIPLIPLILLIPLIPLIPPIVEED